MSKLLLTKTLLASIAVLAMLLPGAHARAAAAPLPAPARAAGDSQVLFAILTGDQQVPPVETRGAGAAAFEVARDRSGIKFQVAARNLSGDVLEAHIHLGGPGVNGPVVVGLFEGSASGKEFFTSGTFTPADQTGPLAGEPDFDRLLAAMSRGGAYVNVHTTTFPDGEVRGQTHEADA
jgi:CHRD domain